MCSRAPAGLRMHTRPETESAELFRTVDKPGLYPLTLSGGKLDDFSSVEHAFIHLATGLLISIWPAVLSYSLDYWKK